MADEIVVTPEMIEAGRRELAEWCALFEQPSPHDVYFASIYRAMRALEPAVKAGDIDMKKLERWQLEVIAAGGSAEDARVRPDQIIR